MATIPQSKLIPRAKKTEDSFPLSEAEKRRYEDIVTIQRLLSEGYPPVQIKDLLHTSFTRIRRYATGDPYKLCRFNCMRPSGIEQYRDEIIALLGQNIPQNKALIKITELGFQGKHSAFGDYCRKLILELGIDYRPRNNAAGVAINPAAPKPSYHYVSKSTFFKYLWSGKEFPANDLDYITTKYPAILEIQNCIKDFRAIYNQKSCDLLEDFVKSYSASKHKPIASFASGLKSDLDAVKNSVKSDLNNGYVEGNNNKIKAIKRMMYGRAKIDLLRVKVLYAR